MPAWPNDDAARDRIRKEEEQSKKGAPCEKCGTWKYPSEADLMCFHEVLEWYATR